MHLIELWDYKKRLATRKSVDFKKTNKTWNRSRFNKRENIGYTMDLIKRCKPNSHEEWEEFYNKSGEEAHNLNKKVKFSSFAELREYIYNVNCSHGKTKQDLLKLASDFQECLKRDGINLDLESCFNYIYIRAVDETYIGYQREMAAFNILNDFCKKNNYTLVDTDDVTDVRYGIDYEIYNDDKLVCGIQVKSSIYRKSVESDARYSDVEYSDHILKEVNSIYSRRTGAPVFYAYIKQDLTLENTSLYNSILSVNNINLDPER